MIIVKLQGGLGNQLFQYAAGRNLALKNDAELKLDISSYKEDSKRHYTLDVFNINASIASEDEILLLKKYKKYYGVKNIFHNLFVMNPDKYVVDDHIFTTKEQDCYLDGYWVNERYFSNIEGIIRKELSLKEPPSDYYKEMMDKMNTCESVTVHIRRGDYISESKTKKVHDICNIKYYEKAISLLVEKVYSPSFFIFSDDISWAKENLKINYPTTFVGPPNPIDYQELMTMSHSKHFIIANSTFSWWAAWLSNNKDKIVISPSKWLRKENHDAKKAFLPENWLTIDVE